MPYEVHMDCRSIEVLYFVHFFILQDSPIRFRVYIDQYEHFEDHLASP